MDLAARERLLTWPMLRCRPPAADRTVRNRLSSEEAVHASKMVQKVRGNWGLRLAEHVKSLTGRVEPGSAVAST